MYTFLDDRPHAARMSQISIAWAHTTSSNLTIIPRDQGLLGRRCRWTAACSTPASSRSLDGPPSSSVYLSSGGPAPAFLSRAMRVG